MPRTIFRAIVLLAFLAAFLTGCGPFVTIQPQEIGVIFNIMTGELEDSIGPGSHLINPLTQVVTIYPTGQQEYTLAFSLDENGQPNGDEIVARTTDGQEVRIDITVIYRIDPAQVNTVHIRWQDRYPEDFVVPTVRFAVREIVADHTAVEIYGDYMTLQTEIQEALDIAFSAEGLDLSQALIRNINFTKEFSTAIELQMIATQNASKNTTATPMP